MVLAARVQRVTPSLTLAIAAKAKAMQAEGLDVCSFSAGEPDFDTPEHIKAAAAKALAEGRTKYGPAAGLMSLREVIATQLKQDNGLNYSANQVIVTNGGKQGLFNLALALLEAGDEVILPAPYWVSYPEMIALADAKAVIIDTAATGNKLTATQLQAALTPQTKLVILNSPGNPTGCVYSRAELEALAAVITSQPNLYVVSDEIYEKLVYGDATHVSIGSLGEAIASRTISSSGFAKAYAMTGWRVGWLAGPSDIINACISIQGHSTSNVCTFAQYGAITALSSPDSAEAIATMHAAFSERRLVMGERLRAIPGLSFAPPEGAFYILVKIATTGLDSRSFCDRLLQEHHVAAVPGIAFGADDHIRFSYACDLRTIHKGMDRLGKFVAQLA